MHGASIYSGLQFKPFSSLKKLTPLNHLHWCGCYFTAMLLIIKRSLLSPRTLWCVHALSADSSLQSLGRAPALKRLKQLWRGFKTQSHFQNVDFCNFGYQICTTHVQQWTKIGILTKMASVSWCAWIRGRWTILDDLKSQWSLSGYLSDKQLNSMCTEAGHNASIQSWLTDH